MANIKRSRLFYGALLLISLWAGLWLYGDAIHLPFYHDDAVVIRALDRQSLADVWSSSPLLPYYRPLSYLPWKLMQAIGGRADPRGAHFLVFGVHVLNTVLVGLLARAWTQERGEWAGLIAAAWFATFPFNYQVVAWVTALPHVLVTASAAGSVLMALHWRRSRARWALPALWACAFVGIFAHENGVLVMTLVALALAVDSGRVEVRRLALPLAPLAAMAALYVAGWLAAPKVNTGPSFSLESMAQNLSYLSQGLAHPLALLGRPLMALGMNDQWAARLSVLAALALLIGAIWRANRRGGVFALGWYAAAMSLSVVFLGFDYVVDSPRLMYFPAAGAALAWASVVSSQKQLGFSWLKPWDNRKLRSAFLRWIALAAALISGAWFVQGRMALYGRLGAFYWDATWQAVEVGGPAVFINAPTWAAYREPVYALGHEGVAFLADYMGLKDFIWVNTGIEVNIDTVYLGDRVRPASYWVAYHRGDAGTVEAVDAAAARAVYQSVAMEDRFMLWSAWRENDADIDTPVAAFSSGAVLLDAAAQVRGDTLRVSMAWHAEEPFGETLFLHVLCDGVMAAQADGPLLGRSWPAGTAWRELREVALPAGVDAGCVNARAGLYNAANGARVDVWGPDGASFSDNAVTISPE